MFKIIQDLLAPSGTRGKTQFQLLVSRLPEEHKARWFAGAALNTSEQAMSSVMSTALSRLNAFLDSELEQILCFDTAIDAEKFCSTKSAIFIVLPEEDTSKHFIVSLIVQQMYREILAVADENDGRLKNRVMMYLDEFGTIPKIEGAEMMFSASRSRRVSIVAIIQSFAQLQKNYAKEGCEIITDDARHERYTGVGTDRILQNLSLINGEGARIRLRCILVNGVNTETKHYEAIAEIARTIRALDGVEFLPYHAYAGTKCVFLGREDNGRTDWIPTEEQIGQAKSIVREAGVPIL